MFIRLHQGNDLATREGKALTKFLEDHGYEYARTNTKGFRVYKHPKLQGSLATQAVTHSVDEREVVAIVATISKALGIDPPQAGQKRKAGQIKARAAADRRATQEEYDRNKAEYEALVAEKEQKIAHHLAKQREQDAVYDGLGEYLTREEMLDLGRRIEQRLAKTLDLQRELARRPQP